MNENNQEHPIEFVSRTLSSAEINYSQVNKEALAIIFGVNKVNKFLWGTFFTIRCDCKPFTIIFGPKKGVPLVTTGRLQGYAIFLAGYNFKVQFVTSKKNSGDVLSRLPVDIGKESMSETLYLHCVDEFKIINAELVQKETSKDLLLSKVKYYIRQGWPRSVEISLETYEQKQELLSIEQNIVL